MLFPAAIALRERGPVEGIFRTAATPFHLHQSPRAREAEACNSTVGILLKIKYPSCQDQPNVKQAQPARRLDYAFDAELHVFDQRVLNDLFGPRDYFGLYPENLFDRLDTSDKE